MEGLDARKQEIVEKAIAAADKVIAEASGGDGRGRDLLTVEMTTQLMARMLHQLFWMKFQEREKALLGARD